MKTHKVTYVIFFALILIAGTLKSQSTFIEYTYDNAGNRISRTVISMRLRKDTSQDSTKTKDSLLTKKQFTDSTALFSENAGNINVSVYPNPTKGLLNLEIENTETPNERISAEYSIINENGNIIFNKKYLGKLQAIDFTMYSAGIYYLKIKNEKINKTIKIVKSE